MQKCVADNIKVLFKYGCGFTFSPAVRHPNGHIFVKWVFGE